MQSGEHSIRSDISLPLIRDELETQSSRVQDATVEECLSLLQDELPVLNVDAHAAFCEAALGQFPAAYVALDASRPWMLYWSLLSLYLLGEDVTVYRDRVIATFRPLQSTTGGFGGGQGHLAHLAGTYAALLTLALVGGEDAYSLINRERLWTWLGHLKQADGGFRVCYDGEEDTRGVYCALVAIRLLNLPDSLPEDAPARKFGLTKFSDRVREYLSRCQTYEGGIAGSPGNEAHGAYTFCALACLCLLDPPHTALSDNLDLPALIRWLSSRQYSPEGGLAGRTNKLVDGCYSHWLGGCWPLIEAGLDGPQEGEKMEDWPALFSPTGLQRYILCCCQAEMGGLRDKPSTRPDTYHTCYNLVGLSMTTFKHFYALRDDQTAGLVHWQTIKREKRDAEVLDSSADRYVNPVFVIPMANVDAIVQHFSSIELGSVQK